MNLGERMRETGLRSTRDRLNEMMDSAILRHSGRREPAVREFIGEIAAAKNFSLAWELCGVYHTVAAHGIFSARLPLHKIAAPDRHSTTETREEGAPARGDTAPEPAIDELNPGSGMSASERAISPVRPINVPPTPAAAPAAYSAVGAAAVSSAAERAWEPELRHWGEMTMRETEMAAATDAHHARFKKAVVEVLESRSVQRSDRRKVREFLDSREAKILWDEARNG